jgi:transcriptional regulator of arginine metabolism
MRILREGHASSQKEIVRALRHAGHDVTQATVSRDLREIGAFKVRSGTGLVYRLSDDVPHSFNGDLVARNLDRSLAEFALDIRRAHSLVIVSTAPGHASAVARAIDLAAPERVMGTVAGDDTIFVATASPDAAGALAEQWWREVSDAGRAELVDKEGANR